MKLPISVSSNGIVGLLVERVRQFDRIAARLDQRPGAPGDAEHVGVDRVEPAMARAGGVRHAGFRLDPLRADPAVAVPQRLAVLERDAVDHAVAGEPVIALRLGRGGVGADAQIAAVEFGGDRAGDGQILQRQFGGPSACGCRSGTDGRCRASACG